MQVVQFIPFQSTFYSLFFLVLDWALVSDVLAVFFNLFAAAEPSANVCVAHGTICNDSSVYLTFIINQMSRYVASMFYFYGSAESLGATRETLRFRGTAVENPALWHRQNDILYSEKFTTVKQR